MKHADKSAAANIVNLRAGDVLTEWTKPVPHSMSAALKDLAALTEAYSDLSTHLDGIKSGNTVALVSLPAERQARHDLAIFDAIALAREEAAAVYWHQWELREHLFTLASLCLNRLERSE